MKSKHLTFYTSASLGSSAEWLGHMLEPWWLHHLVATRSWGNNFKFQVLSFISPYVR